MEERERGQAGAHSFFRFRSRARSLSPLHFSSRTPPPGVPPEASTYVYFRDAILPASDAEDAEGLAFSDSEGEGGASGANPMASLRGVGGRPGLSLKSARSAARSSE